MYVASDWRSFLFCRIGVCNIWCQIIRRVQKNPAWKKNKGKKCPSRQALEARVHFVKKTMLCHCYSSLSSVDEQRAWCLSVGTDNCSSNSWRWSSPPLSFHTLLGLQRALRATVISPVCCKKLVSRSRLENQFMMDCPHMHREMLYTGHVYHFHLQHEQGRSQHSRSEYTRVSFSFSWEKKMRISAARVSISFVAWMVVPPNSCSGAMLSDKAKGAGAKQHNIVLTHD